MRLFNGPELDPDKELTKNKEGYYLFPLDCPDYYLELHYEDKLSIQLPDGDWYNFVNSKKTGTKIPQLKEVGVKLKIMPLYVYQTWDSNGKVISERRLGKQQVRIDNENENKEFYV